MLEKIRGQIISLRELSKTETQFELQDVDLVIEMSTEDYWVLNKGDTVTVVGEKDDDSGKFIAYAYYNDSKGIFGNQQDKTIVGYIFIVTAIAFFWGIFPLFIHLPMGIKDVKEGKKVQRSMHLIDQDD
ncbi:hypothetical protein GKR75_07925 [Providencia sp. wls1919]|nr:hypothetical protein [Providencia sp. wls1919]